MSESLAVPRLAAEPTIKVGLLDDEPQVRFVLSDTFHDEGGGGALPAGEYVVRREGDALRLDGPRPLRAPGFSLHPSSAAGQFRLTTEIGRGFHWAEYEEQAFPAALCLVPATAGTGVTAINRVPTERYLTSVICSEMSSSSPRALLEAHAVVSRSWLLARQVAKQRWSASTDHAVLDGATVAQADANTIIRWYDSIKHADFDVCAEDHCQRYHGSLRVANPQAAAAIAATRGQVLTHGGNVCETVYSKCCGGRTEDARVAWGDGAVPYLMPVDDLPGDVDSLPPSLGQEADFQAFLEQPPPAAYCNCEDEEILHLVLPPRDQRTRHFFRWTERLTPARAGELVHEKLGRDLGPIRAIEPLERGVSGRLRTVRLVGEKGALIVGKELEIRRALSPSHLYSSAFLVEYEGEAGQPDALILHGAGWGHGVGLCQVGAAVMAYRGHTYEEILQHYYPGTQLQGAYL